MAENQQFSDSDDARSVCSVDSSDEACAATVATVPAPRPVLRRRRTWRLRTNAGARVATSVAARAAPAKRSRDDSETGDSRVIALTAQVSNLKEQQARLHNQLRSVAMDQIVLRARQTVLLRRLRARIAAAAATQA